MPWGGTFLLSFGAYVFTHALFSIVFTVICQTYISTPSTFFVSVFASDPHLSFRSPSLCSHWHMLALSRPRCFLPLSALYLLAITFLPFSQSFLLKHFIRPNNYMRPSFLFPHNDNLLHRSTGNHLFASPLLEPFTLPHNTRHHMVAGKALRLRWGHVISRFRPLSFALLSGLSS